MKKLTIEMEESTYHIIIGCFAKMNLDYKKFLKVIKEEGKGKYD